MKSAGYDMVLLINEALLNQVTGALFYNGFLKLNGSVDLKNELPSDIAASIDESLTKYMTVKYRFKLNHEPYIDFVTTTESLFPLMRIHLTLRGYFWLWDGVELKFNINLTLLSDLGFDQSTGEMVFDYSNCTIEELTLSMSQFLESNVTIKLNKIVEDSIMEYLRQKESPLRINLPSIDPYLPTIPKIEANKLPVRIKAIKLVTSTVVAIGINFDIPDKNGEIYEGGNPDELRSFAKNCSLASALSEHGMKKIFDFFWEKSSLSKQYKYSKSLELDEDGWINEIVNLFMTPAEIATYIASKICTLGFIEATIDYKNIGFEIDLQAILHSKPDFDLLHEDKVLLSNIDLSVLVELKPYVKVEFKVEVDSSGFIPDFLTPWEDDVVLEKRTEKIPFFYMPLPFPHMRVDQCIGRISFDEATNTFKIKVEKINLYWDFIRFTDFPLLDFPERVLNLLIDLFEESIAKKIPEMTVSPPYRFDMPDIPAIDLGKIGELKSMPIPWKLIAKTKDIQLTNSEIVMRAQLNFTELQKRMPFVPKYIVNINNHEVHKIGCDCLLDTYEEHQVGYHLLYDALNAGNDGCKNCLLAFHRM